MGPRATPVILPRGSVAVHRGGRTCWASWPSACSTGSLADRVRKVDAQLADASTAIADLQAYSDHIINSLTMGLVTSDLRAAS